jgi:hypothetical protein
MEHVQELAKEEAHKNVHCTNKHLVCVTTATISGATFYVLKTSTN